MSDKIDITHHLVTLAASAPKDIPTWFKVEEPAGRPEVVPHASTIFERKELSEYNAYKNGYVSWKENVGLVSQDIPEKYRPHIVKEVEYSMAFWQWNLVRGEARYFQWRVFFARAMIERLFDV